MGGPTWTTVSHSGVKGACTTLLKNNAGERVKRTRSNAGRYSVNASLSRLTRRTAKIAPTGCAVGLVSLLVSLQYDASCLSTCRAECRVKLKKLVRQPRHGQPKLLVTKES